jgi:retron-type reverse transcriptase
MLGKSVEEIDAILADKEKHVTRIAIPKKDGSKRIILSPDSDLKYLQKMVYWKILKRYRPSVAAHGFVTRRSIVTNARPHVGSLSVGKLDIKSFFDSISVDHLKNCLFGNKNICRQCKYYERMLQGRCNPSLYHNKLTNFEFKCEEIKAVYIPRYCSETGYQSLLTRVIEICTYDGFTAQGFPTSPALANIVMRGFDEAMLKHCSEHGVIYTRYADDLAFSSKTLTKQQLKDIIYKKVIRLLWAFKFKPNYKKIVWKSKSARMRVCGVVVNVKTSVQKSDVHRFRAEVHRATVKEPEKTTKSMMRKMKGWASFLMSIDHDKGSKYMEKLVKFEKKHDWSKRGGGGEV